MYVPVQSGRVLSKIFPTPSMQRLYVRSTAGGPLYILLLYDKPVNMLIYLYRAGGRKFIGVVLLGHVPGLPDSVDQRSVLVYLVTKICVDLCRFNSIHHIPWLLLRRTVRRMFKVERRGTGMVILQSSRDISFARIFYERRTALAC